MTAPGTTPPASPLPGRGRPPGPPWPGCDCTNCRNARPAKMVRDGALAIVVVGCTLACMFGLISGITGDDYPYPPGTGYVLAELAAAAVAGSWAILTAPGRGSGPGRRGS